MRLNICRQELAAKNGLLSFLGKINSYEQNVNRFAIPLLCEFIRNTTDFKLLWQNNILDVLISLLKDVCWKYSAVDGIIYWYSKDQKNVEPFILNQYGEIFAYNLLSTAINDTEQFTSQILRLVTVSPVFAKYLLAKGVLPKIIEIFNLHPNTQTLIKLLKILEAWLHLSLKKYWAKNQNELKRLYRCISEAQTSVSVLVSSRASLILEKIRAQFEK